MKKLLFTLLCLVLAAFIAVVGVYSSQKKQLKAYKNNTFSLLDTVKRYKVNDSLNAVKVRSLQLTVEEFKTFRAKDVELIQGMGIALKRSQSVTKLATSVESNIKAEVEIIHDTLEVFPTYVIDYSDKWVDVHGKVSASGADLCTVTRDSVLIVPNFVPRRFLFFKFGKKYTGVNAVSLNPRSNITFIEHTELR